MCSIKKQVQLRLVLLIFLKSASYLKIEKISVVRVIRPSELTKNKKTRMKIQQVKMTFNYWIFHAN
jgi:hypothetical protein